MQRLCVIASGNGIVLDLVLSSGKFELQYHVCYGKDEFVLKTKPSELQVNTGSWAFVCVSHQSPTFGRSVGNVNIGINDQIFSGFGLAFPKLYSSDRFDAAIGRDVFDVDALSERFFSGRISTFSLFSTSIDSHQMKVEY